ncbi:hypothetical protein [uncultured Tateyamaria sp.]|uniref:hypothetical protein n=1 Tax=uncultured Tateyamaria sp. TaxID=455651 RepID=UPI00260BF42D|nr:hypothetical protein [uncultured Tateyamaria sp.]
MDAFLNEAHEAVGQGTLSADGIRDLFITLSRTHPQTARFVRNWAERAPDNANAQIARAWSIWHEAYQIE